MKSTPHDDKNTAPGATGPLPSIGRTGSPHCCATLPRRTPPCTTVRTDDTAGSTTHDDTAVNDKPATPNSSFRRRAALNTLGVVVLLLGLGSASLVYWSAQARSARLSNDQATLNAGGGWQDGSLSLVDSKKSSHDLELYNGKVGVLAARLQDWCEKPESWAIMIATISTLTALCCFLAAHRSRLG